MHKKNLNEKQLAEWIDNYVCNKDLPFVTNSVMIGEADLDHIIRTMKEHGADGIRIYFIRYKENDPHIPNPAITAPAPNIHVTFVGRGLTQVSIAIVPTKDYQLDTKTMLGSSSDVINEDGTIAVFFPGGENSGLCPPNCKR